MDILIEEFQSQIWAIALDKGRIEGLEIDPPNETVRYGAIYYAKVIRIDTALDAAFLDLDGDNQAILYNRDVRSIDKDGNIVKGGERSIGRALHPGDMVAVQAKTAYIEHTDPQIWKDSHKLAQASMDITLQGRYLIYCTMLNTNRISKRIRGKKVRDKLQDMLTSLDDLKGFILRSSALDMQTEILKREASILKDIWDKMSVYFKGQEPCLIYEGPDSIQRILSDKATNPIERIEVVTMDHFEKTEDWCSFLAPDLMTKIVPVELDDATQDLALLEHRDLIGQIEALFHNYVMLKHGGNLIVQETAGMTVIDVNKGSDKRSHLALNIEAAIEIGRQLRLRNLGGIVIVDFLKMPAKDQKKLLETLDDETYQDPCTVQIHGLTKLGLMEMTRKKRTASLHRRMDGIEF